MLQNAPSRHRRDRPAAAFSLRLDFVVRLSRTKASAIREAPLCRRGASLHKGVRKSEERCALQL